MDGEVEREERTSFDARVQAALARLSPAEGRTARFFVDQKEAVLLESAAVIGKMAGASDATVVRTARSLGFDSLSALRAFLLLDLTRSQSPGGRLKRTLAETGGDASQALDYVVGIHENVLRVLKSDEVAAAFARAVDILAGAQRRHVFGIGPSGALANYASLQFNRIGMPAHTLSATGVGLADELLFIRKGDAILMLAYAPVYREVTVVLREARERDIPIVLVSDSLGPLVAEHVAEILPVPRGKAGHLAMHGGTMVLIEAITIALAARRRDSAIGTLDRLSALRGSIDKAWLKRGTRKKAWATEVPGRRRHPPKTIEPPFHQPSISTSRRET